MNNLIKSKYLKWILLFFEAIIYGIIFVKRGVIKFDLLSHVIVIILFLINWDYLFKKDRKRIELNRCELILFIIANLIISFLVSGKALFLTEFILPLSFFRLCYFFLVNLFVLPISYNFLCIFDNINILGKNKNENSKKFAITVFLISFISWMIICISYYPGIVTIDSWVQLSQAVGQTQITNAHPAFSTIIISLLLKLWENPFIIVIANVLFFSLVITRIYKYLYEQNINKKLLMISLLIFVFSVNNISLLPIIWKDIPFCISLLWLTFEVYLLAKEKEEYFKSIKKVSFLLISLLFTYFFRHNGMFPYVLIIIYLIYLAFRLSNKARVIITIIISLLSVWFVKGPVFNFFNVDSSNIMTVGSASFAAKGLGALIYYDADISEEDRALINEMLDLEDLKRSYNSYSIDTYSALKGWNPGLEKLGTAKIYELYIKYLIKNPRVIIRDRLDGSNLMWSYQTPSDGYNYKYDYGIDNTQFIDMLNEFKPTIDEKYVPERNFLSYSVKIYQIQTEKIVILDMIFWRCGIALSILLIMCLYMFIKKINMYPVFFTTLASVFFWLVFMNHHSYRYVWFMYLNTFFIIMFILLEKNKKKKINRKVRSNEE